MLAALAAASCPITAWSAAVEVPEGVGTLAAAIGIADPGDELHLVTGTYRGNLVLDRPVSIIGVPGATIEGDGHGRVVEITAPDVHVTGVRITGSGTDLPAMDAGIFLSETADRAVIERDQIDGNLIGVLVHGAHDVRVDRNVIVGLKAGRIADAGNGIQVWNAPGALIVENRVSYGRDGIFTLSSRQDTFRGNRFDHVRFAIHYMYTNDSEITDNVSVGNDVGLALMFSDRLLVRGNVSEGDRQNALLMNYVNSSTIEHNVLRHSDKCVFLYNANKNRFRENWIEGCETGIHFTAGAERNEIAGNAFVANRNQVLYVGTRTLDWSVNGRGNYWSDNPAFDLKGTGIAEEAYRPNDLVDRVVWSAPAAKLLLNSPAVQIVRWAQKQFPALHPGGVIDTAPLMRPPPIPLPTARLLAEMEP